MPAGGATGGRILPHDDPRLRRRCLPVGPDGDAGALARDLWRALDATDGVGLAAPQLGDPRRVVVCRLPRDHGGERLTLVDPELTAASGPDEVMEEGCLSFPGLYLRVRRPSSAALRWRDLAGERRERLCTGLLARIVQHEIDHLDGVLFVDHQPAWRRWLLRRRLGVRHGGGERA